MRFFLRPCCACELFYTPPPFFTGTKINADFVLRTMMGGFFFMPVVISFVVVFSPVKVMRLATFFWERGEVVCAIVIKR